MLTELIAQIDCELRARGSAERAEHERAYLKSGLEHYGTSVPAIRAVVRAVASQHPDLPHDDLLRLVDGLWAVRVHDRRAAAVELLAVYQRPLASQDVLFIERLLRESRTWALVDPLAVWVTGRLFARYPEVGVVLDRWSQDPDFWIRRASLLALLEPLRRGEGDFDRFAGYADAMLGEKEFFVHKAIGWVLRETGKKRPDLTFAWLLPRASRASAVTIREAVKPLAEWQRSAVLASR